MRFCDGSVLVSQGLLRFRDGFISFFRFQCSFVWISHGIRIRADTNNL